MELKEMNVEQLEARKAELLTEVEATEEREQLDAIEADINAIKAELDERRAVEAQKAEIRQAVADGQVGEVVKEFKEESRGKNMYSVDSIEYRDAWTKKIIGRDLNEEERSALSSAGAVIPKMTVDAVWDKLVKEAELLSKVDVSQFPNYVRFPVATTNNPATSQAVGGSITESSDVIGYVDLVPNEYVKLLTVGADIDHMAVSAVHDWIVNNIVTNIRYAINKDILVGSGSNALKGIKESVNASASYYIPSTVTKASLLKVMGALGSQYQNGAVWIMSPEMFYEGVMTVTALNDYIINDGFAYKLFGHDVVLMSEAVISSAENVFYGDPKAYKVNIFKALEVKPFETATTTNIQFRGATMADGELLDTSAFVRFVQTS